VLQTIASSRVEPAFRFWGGGRLKKKKKKIKGKIYLFIFFKGKIYLSWVTKSTYHHWLAVICSI
jgi:hypothetical protein